MGFSSHRKAIKGSRSGVAPDIGDSSGHGRKDSVGRDGRLGSVGDLERLRKPNSRHGLARKIWHKKRRGCVKVDGDGGKGFVCFILADYLDNGIYMESYLYMYGRAHWGQDSTHSPLPRGNNRSNHRHRMRLICCSSHNPRHPSSTSTWSDLHAHEAKSERSE